MDGPTVRRAEGGDTVERLTLRDDDGRALLTPYGLRMYCSTQATADCICKLEEALQAQEPVEPVMDIDTWKCGNCGHTLEHQELLGDNVLFHEQYNYCPECGRPVKWE